ncbi:hypothetical protein KJ359_002272 [Pestalotiopsis sp. 9143b]|nr:hypothetical protein KJ359_002272 [Pestalotiopsis sp. 9143b]
MEADEIDSVARPLSADVKSDVPGKIETSRGAAIPGHSDATVTRMRSNNGHGCAELDDSADEAEAVSRVDGPVKDPFEARFFDGFAGSAFLSVAGGTVNDVFRRDSIQAPMTIISLSPFIDPVKLREKARALRKETGDDRWKAPMEKHNKSVAKSLGYSLLRPFQLLAFEPSKQTLFTLSCPKLFGSSYMDGLQMTSDNTGETAYALIFGNVYGFNLWQTGLAFLGIMVGMLAASATNPIWHRVYNRLLAQNGGIPEPEFRLPSAVMGALLVPIGLFWFAWSAYPWVHWIVPIIGSGVFGMG